MFLKFTKPLTDEQFEILLKVHEIDEMYLEFGLEESYLNPFDCLGHDGIFMSTTEAEYGSFELVDGWFAYCVDWLITNVLSQFGVGIENCSCNIVNGFDCMPENMYKLVISNNQVHTYKAKEILYKTEDFYPELLVAIDA